MSLLAKDIMQPDIHTVSPNMTLQDVDKIFYNKKISGAPVIDNEKLIGVVSRTDISHQLTTDLEASEGDSSFFWDTDGNARDIIIGGCDTPEALVKKMQEYMMKYCVK